MERIPLADPRRDLSLLRTDIAQAIDQVVGSGSYILGTRVDAFERAASADIGGVGVAGVGSGTDALILALLALDIGPGDEVITVSHTAGPTVAAINSTGASPVLIDVEADTFCLDPALLSSAISSRTKAILPVHLYGHPADMAAIVTLAEKRGIAVIEDCAQAQGGSCGDRKVGTIGDIGCFSFYPTKNLGALGDGGMVSARSPQLIEKLRRLRTYGWTKPQFAEVFRGRCSRLDEIQAAILAVKLRHLDGDIERRRAIANLYREGLAGLPIVLPSERAGYRHAYHLYVIRCAQRDALASHLDAAQIGTGKHYPYPVHRQPGLMQQARISGSLAVTETLAKEVLSLPLFPSLTEVEVQRVISSIRSFFGN